MKKLNKGDEVYEVRIVRESGYEVVYGLLLNASIRNGDVEVSRADKTARSTLVDIFESEFDPA